MLLVNLVFKCGEYTNILVLHAYASTSTCSVACKVASLQDTPVSTPSVSLTDSEQQAKCFHHCDFRAVATVVTVVGVVEAFGLLDWVCQADQ